MIKNIHVDHEGVFHHGKNRVFNDSSMAHLFDNTKEHGNVNVAAARKVASFVTADKHSDTEKFINEFIPAFQKMTSNGYSEDFAGGIPDGRLSLREDDSLDTSRVQELCRAIFQPSFRVSGKYPNRIWEIQHTNKRRRAALCYYFDESKEDDGNGTDIDAKCDEADCHFDAFCLEGENTYVCVCNEGFTGDGDNCVA